MYLDMPCSNESLALLFVLQTWQLQLDATAVCSFEVELFDDCLNAYIHFIVIDVVLRDCLFSLLEQRLLKFV